MIWKLVCWFRHRVAAVGALSSPLKDRCAAQHCEGPSALFSFRLRATKASWNVRAGQQTVTTARAMRTVAHDPTLEHLAIRVSKHRANSGSLLAEVADKECATLFSGTYAIRRLHGTD